MFLLVHSSEGMVQYVPGIPGRERKRGGGGPKATPMYNSYTNTLDLGCMMCLRDILEISGRYPRLFLVLFLSFWSCSAAVSGLLESNK